ncbi:MAG: SBBP repeat-containing protein [Myxococcota bacterium]
MRKLSRLSISLIFLTACGSSDVESTAPPLDERNSAQPGLSPELRPPSGSEIDGDILIERTWSTVATLIGPTQEDEIDGLAIDGELNVYLSGKFEQTLQIADTVLESAGAADIMVAKYNRDGLIVWIRQFGSTGEDNIFDVATDANGNIYLSGSFSGTVEFGTFTLSTTGDDDQDALLMKLSPDGSVLWARQAGSANSDGGSEISVSLLGPIVAGVQSNGALSIGSFDFERQGQSDSYLVSLSPLDGTVLWARAIPSTVFSRTKCLSVDAGGNIYNGGDFAGRMEYPEPATTLVASDPDAFLTKWSPAGRFEWAIRWGGDGEDICEGVVSTRERVYAAGYFADTVDVAPTLVASKARDQFVLGISSSGAVEWSAQVMSNADLQGSEIALDRTGGPVFAISAIDGFSVVDAEGQLVTPAVEGSPIFLRFSPTGDLRGLLAPSSGEDLGLPGEIAVSGNRVVLDSSYVGPSGTMDASVLMGSLENLSLEERKYTLIVTDGYGSGRYAPGEIVHISSRVAPLQEAHLRWTGDIEVDNEWHTTFVMPARDIALTAEVASVSFEREDSDYLGMSDTVKTRRLFTPAASPIGLLLLLHGTGGSSAMVDRTEVHAFVLDAVQEGFSVVALDSEETASGQDINGDGNLRWNTELTETNVDLANINNVLVKLRSEGYLDASMTLHAFGTSNGGGMATTLGGVADSDGADAFPELRFHSVASMCAAGQAATAFTRTASSWWMCGEQAQAVLKNSQALASSFALQQRAVRSSTTVQGPWPLLPEHLLRLPNVGTQDAADLHADLISFGAIDESGKVLMNSADLIREVSLEDLSTTLLSAEISRELRSQLDMHYAEHEFFSTRSQGILRFLAVSE